MGRAVVEAPKEIFSEAIFPTLTALKPGNLSFKFLQPLREALNPDILGFRIKQMEIFKWNLETSGKTTDAFQVIIHPGKEIK